MLTPQAHAEGQDSFEAYQASLISLGAAITDLRTFIAQKKEADRQIPRRWPDERSALRNVQVLTDSGAVDLFFGQEIRHGREVMGSQDVLTVQSGQHRLRYGSYCNKLSLDEKSDVKWIHPTDPNDIYVEYFNGHKAHSIGAKGVEYIDAQYIADYHEHGRRRKEWERTANQLRQTWKYAMSQLLWSPAAKFVYSEPPEIPRAEWKPELKTTGFREVIEVIQTMTRLTEEGLAALRK